MVYTKQTWSDGPSGNTPVSAARLLHIEDGIFAAHSYSVSALSPGFNVPTNGTSDATAGLTAWLAALGPNTVGVLPAGNYVVSSQLIIPAGVTIGAYGATITVTGAPGPAQAIRLSTGSRLLGLHLTSTRPFDSTNAQIGIFCAGISDFQIRDVEVDGFGITGINASGGSSNFLLSNVRVHNIGNKDDGAGNFYGDGIVLSEAVHSFRLVNIDVRDNGRQGLSAWMPSPDVAAERFFISGVLAENNGDTGVTLARVRDFVLDGVQAQSNGFNGGPWGGQGVQIVGDENNWGTYGRGILSAITAINNQEYGVQVSFSSDITLSGITALGNVWDGVILHQTNTSTLSAVTAEGNQLNGVKVDNCWGAVVGTVSAASNGKHGLSVEGSSSDCVISGVRTANNGTVVTFSAGITGANSSNILIADVIAADNKATHTQEYGVRLFNVAGAEVRGIRGSGNRSQLFLADAGSANYVLDNPSDTTAAYGGRTLANGVRQLTGAGSPEGVVAGPIGSTYSRSDGGAGTSFYVKQTGTGNTGWVGK